MSNFKVVLNYKGVGQMLKSQEAAELVESYAEDVLAKAGEGYAINQQIVKDRQSALVHTTTYEAKHDCYENNTLLKCLY